MYIDTIVKMIKLKKEVEIARLGIIKMSDLKLVVIFILNYEALDKLRQIRNKMVDGDFAGLMQQQLAISKKFQKNGNLISKSQIRVAMSLAKQYHSIINKGV